MTAGRLAAVVGLAVVLVAGACSSSHDSKGATTTAGPSTTAVTGAGSLARVHLSTEEVAKLDAPIALATRAGTGDLYVAEKGGKVVRLVASSTTQGATTSTTGTPTTYRTDPTPVLDVSSSIVDGGEQGLLGLVFSSDGRRLFTFSTLAPDGTSSVDAYDIGDATSVTARTPRHRLLSLARQFPNHNGGDLVFGPDGYLYIGIGDGGSEGDPDHHGQDDTTLFAKILRIDPGGATGTSPGTLQATGTSYGIPTGNPFLHGGGRPEIWITGVRNPWRFSFDRATGDLWVADVGQDHGEEIDHLPTSDDGPGRGANLGWSLVEGDHRFRGTNPTGGILPIHEYSHDHGCSITGGYVYRGTAIPGLAGAYLYADYCEEGLRALTTSGGRVTGMRTFDLPLPQVQSFGEDDAGNVYVLLSSGPLLRLVEG